MAKIKIHELAKEINVASKEIVNLLKEQGSDVKSHMSNIEENDIIKVRKFFAGKGTGTPPVRAEVKPEAVKSMTSDKETVETPAPVTRNVYREMEESLKASEERRREAEKQRLLNNSGNAAQGSQRPQGSGYQGQRPHSQGSGYQGNRPAGQGSGYQGNRPQGQGSGYQGNRPQGQGSGYQGNRPAGQGGGYQGNRPAGQGQGTGYQGNRPAGQGQGTGYQGNRPQGQGSGYQGNRPAGQGQGTGYQGNRPAGQGGYQGNRPAGQGGGYQGNRPAGQGGGYQGNRPAGQGGYQGNRPAGQGQGSGYQGNRPQGQGGYQGNRPAGQGSGYQGNRPQGQGGGYQGNRPAGQGQGTGYQGNRPAGQGQGTGYQGNRPAGQGGYQGNRPPGQYGGAPRTGQYGRTGGGFDKDKDSGFGNRGFGDRRGQKSDGKSDKGSIKSDLVNELTKEQRATAFSDKNKDKKKKDYGLDKDNKNKNKKDPNRKGAFIMPKPKTVVHKGEDEVRTIMIPDIVTIKELAEKLKKPAAAMIKKLFLSGKMVSINSELTFEEAEEFAIEYNCIVEKEVKVNVVEELLKEEEEDEGLMEKRPPVVCVMGHVDHGKTSLLDAIRETNVTAREAGGITQHIGAYQVEINDEVITFLDTPGHEAFTSMRMRGAKSTDIAILVVAADDGVMPQTIEAINHAKAANIQIIVAINKIDKPGANIDRVKQELTEHSLVAEDWGGETIFVPVSAKTREGIENLLEMVLLTAEVCELKANANRKARGIVIEAELDKGRGPVATILVQKGTLQVGDNVAIGSVHGKVRAMMDDMGRRVKEVTPSMPVEILGLNGVPDAGEIVIAVKDEKEARTIAEAFISQGKERLLADTKARLSLDGLFSQIQAGNVKELNLIIKADVQGSVEAVKQSLIKLSNEEVLVRAIHGGVGAINESDVNLASASNAIIIGFNVKPDNTAKEIADREKVEVKLYKVIYNAIEDVEAAMKGMLKPIFAEKIIGHAEIRQIFKASGLGVIAGSYVLDGKIVRGSSVRINRAGTLTYEGPLASLKRFKDDVKEVASGYECGLLFDKFEDLQELDVVEFYVMEEVPR